MIKKLFRSLRLFFRSNRYHSIVALTGIESSLGLVLDLGGGPASFFAALFPHPERIILVDIDSTLAWRARERTAAHILVANGEKLPLADRSIDTIVCNSVIEHVSDPGALATEIRRVGRNHFVQTPNGGFLLETHSFIPIPLYSLIPWRSLRRLVCKAFGADYDYVSSVKYLTERQLRSLFPDSTITYEKVLSLIKSFYVYHLEENEL